MNSDIVKCKQCGTKNRIAKSYQANRRPVCSRCSAPLLNDAGEQSIKNKYEQYKKLTEARDWDGICKLNNVEIKQCKFGTMKELDGLPGQLQKGEVVFGFTAGIMSSNSDSNITDWLPNTWLLVLTDRRFLFLDAALLTKSIDVHSILHKNVQGVLVSQGFILGKISIETGSRSTVIDNCEKRTVKIIGDLANDWLQILEERKSNHQESYAGSSDSGLDKIKKLGELKALGFVSEQEFNDAKAKILASL
jgi:hypothetical protein